MYTGKETQSVGDKRFVVLNAFEDGINRRLRAFRLEGWVIEGSLRPYAGGSRVPHGAHRYTRPHPHFRATLCKVR